MRSRTSLWCLVVALCGCTGVATMRRLSPDAGLEVRYTAPPDTLLAAVPTALARHHLRLKIEEPVDSLTTMLIAAKPATVFSYGEWVRVLVRQNSDSGPTVTRFVARSGALFDWSGRADRVAPRLVQALDGTLPAAALGPLPGMRARGRRTDRHASTVRGTVATLPNRTLLLVSDATATDSLPLAALRDVSIWRGAYSHRAEGATVGMLVGMVGGALIGAAASEGSPGGWGASLGMQIGMVVGMAVGSGIGAVTRTDVWSPLDRPD